MENSQNKNKKKNNPPLNEENEDVDLEEENEKQNELNIKLDNIGNNKSKNAEGDDDEDEEEKNYLNNNFMKDLIKIEEFPLLNEEEEDMSNNEKIKDNVIEENILPESQTFKNKNFSEEYLYENYRKNLGKKILINWYIRQIYKYLLFILTIIYYKYGTIYMFYSSDNIRPIWILYFTEISNKFSPLQIIANLFLFSPFSYKTFNWIDPFGLVYNEITFFILGSLLIYVCYKYCLRLDAIILVSFFFFTGLKIILGIFVFIPNGYYPAMFYQYDGKNEKLRSYLSSNQFMNLNVFLLGMFFGEIHYCIYYEESKDKSKKYLILARNLMTYFKKLILKQKLTQTIIIQIFLLALLAGYIVVVFIFEICINKYIEDGNTFFTNERFNIISLFDSDIAVAILLFFLFILFFQRDKKLTRFLEHKYWRILSVPYWSNLLFLHVIAGYIFYLSEKRIKLIIYTVIFRSFQFIIILVLISCFIFVFVEMPLKNITKNFFRIK